MPLPRTLAVTACLLLLGVACSEQTSRTVAQELAPRVDDEPPMPMPMPVGDADLNSEPESDPYALLRGQVDAAPQSPLERIPLGELRVAGVVLGESPTALVEDVSGRGHLVRVGMAIGTGGGHVSAIHEQGLVVEEHHLADDGRVKRRTRTLRLDHRAG